MLWWSNWWLSVNCGFFSPASTVSAAIHVGSWEWCADNWSTWCMWTGTTWVNYKGGWCTCSVAFHCKRCWWRCAHLINIWELWFKVCKILFLSLCYYNLGIRGNHCAGWCAFWARWGLFSFPCVHLRQSIMFQLKQIFSNVSSSIFKEKILNISNTLQKLDFITPCTTFLCKIFLNKNYLHQHHMENQPNMKNLSNLVP